MNYGARYKDLNVQKLVYVHEDDVKDEPIQIEVYGEQLDGTPTWLLLHVAPHCEWKDVSKAERG